MTTLVERLRSYLPFGDGAYWSPTSRAYAEAADRIEQLEAKLKVAEEALQLLYSWAYNWDSEFMNDPDWIHRDGPWVKEALAKIKED